MGKRPELQIDIMRELTEYTAEIAAGVEKAADKRAKEAVKTLKATSPRSKVNHPHYGDNWTIRKQKSGGKLEITIYNKKKPHLTHLLEFGWLKKGGTRVKGRPHIEPAQEQLNKDFEADCERIVENGG